jgi:hypothetical protein
MHFSAQCGRFFYFASGEDVPVPPSANEILLENGDDLLLEDNNLILLEA